MSLREKCVLEITGFDGRTAEFHFRGDLSITEEVEKQYVMAGRGQYITEIWDIGADLIDELPDAGDRRSGVHVDGGAGDHRWSITFTVATDDDTNQWGDGTGDPQFDATGGDATAKQQVFGYWVAQTVSDSRGYARLHVGEWTDGSFSDGAGAFGNPLLIAIQSSRFQKDEDSPSKAECTIEFVRASSVPDIGEALEGYQDDIQNAIDQLGDLVPDI